jgi:hypothetical protein
VGILFFVVLKFVRYLRFNIRRWNLLNFMKFIKKKAKFKENTLFQ